MPKEVENKQSACAIRGSSKSTKPPQRKQKFILYGEKITAIEQSKATWFDFLGTH